MQAGEGEEGRFGWGEEANFVCYSETGAMLVWFGMRSKGEPNLYMLLSRSITLAFAQANFDTSPGGVREIGTGKFKSVSKLKH